MVRGGIGLRFGLANLRYFEIVLLVVLAIFPVPVAVAQIHPIEIDAAPDLPLSGAQVAEGWIALFDGNSLFGWRAETDANWRVEAGEIRVETGPVGLLRTTSQFDDFHLYLEFQADRETNSGVFIRTAPRPTNPAGDCYEINIASSDNPFPTGSLVARSKTEKNLALDDGFNRMRIIANGDSIQVKINGELVNEYRDPRPLGRGYIGLQLNSGAVRFRNVRLLPLNSKAVFDGSDLMAWKQYSKLDGKFTIDDGDLWVQGGPGQIETHELYADFVLQLKCKTKGQQNSGVFFRCVPGEISNGYESQIDNSIREGNRKVPANYGTGGIFRRKEARRVVSENDKWFAKTIAVCGPHISVWVNGYQVVDWTDQRKPHMNPRLGLRLEPGTIMLQAHDGQTDVRFRNVLIRELSPRGR